MSGSDITELRHSISGDSSSSSSSSSSSAKSRPATVQTTPVKVKSIPAAATAAAKKEAQKIESVDRRADLFVKINNYLTSDRLAPYIAPGIRAPAESASLEHMEAIYKQITDSIRSSYKRAMVDMMFEEGIDGIESMCVNFLQMDGMSGIALAIKSDKEMFQPELEEIAIELDSSYVPGPKTRLLWKMARFATRWAAEHRGISNQSNATQQQTKEEDANATTR